LPVFGTPQNGYKRIVEESMKLTVYAQRRKRLLSLAQGKQVVAMTPANKFWLTDFWGAGAAIVLSDRTVVITSPLEADRVRETGKEVEVVVAKGPNDEQRSLVKQLGTGKVLVDDPSGLRLKSKAVSRTREFVQARRIKDQEEIRRIRRASRGLDEIFARMEEFLRAGASEWKVASEVMKLATERRLTPIQDGGALSPVIIASGPNGALPHSELSPRTIKDGDMVVADIFFRFDGYYSDCTRTFAVGTSSPEAKKNYAAVKASQEAALEIAKEGKMCGDVNEAAVDVLRKRGIDRYLNHSIGHGVGIDIHELPRVAKGEKTRLAKNDVITDEPGVYLHGKYGIRIEDTLVVGKRPEVLTKFTKDLVTCD
jgi:Xaa-Pro aminopeptidase/Xaa-Pro dipeptidase